MAAVLHSPILVVLAELELDVVEIQADALAEGGVQATERAQEEPHLCDEARLASVKIERAPVEPVQAPPRTGPRRSTSALDAAEASQLRPAHGWMFLHCALAPLMGKRFMILRELQARVRYPVSLSLDLLWRP